MVQYLEAKDHKDGALHREHIKHQAMGISLPHTTIKPATIILRVAISTRELREAALDCWVKGLSSQVSLLPASGSIWRAREQNKSSNWLAKDSTRPGTRVMGLALLVRFLGVVEQLG